MPDPTRFSTIEVPGTRLELRLSKFDRSIHWLRKHDVPASDLANWFATNTNHIHLLSHRGSALSTKQVIIPFLYNSARSPLEHPAPTDHHLRRLLGIRPQEDHVVLDSEEKRHLEAMEVMTEMAASRFWGGVRFEEGISKFEEILKQTRYPIQHRRIRLRARLRQLIAETHVHAGHSASAIWEGILSLHLYRIAYHEQPVNIRDKSDLENVGRSARLISQAYLLRHDPVNAKRFLDVHAAVCAALNKEMRPEYYGQMATVAEQEGNQDEAARTFYSQAEAALKCVADYGKFKEQHEIWDIGRRRSNLLEPVNWDGSQEMLQVALEKYPIGDIHRAINVNWTAACGFCTDSAKAHCRAIEILSEHPLLSDGFGREATVYRLLRLAENLPAKLRGQWARSVLYENALRDA